MSSRIIDPETGLVEVLDLAGSVYQCIARRDRLEMVQLLDIKLQHKVKVVGDLNFLCQSGQRRQAFYFTCEKAPFLIGRLSNIK